MKSFGFKRKRWNKIEVGDTFHLFRFIFESEGHKRIKNLKQHQLAGVGQQVHIVSHPSRRQKQTHAIMGTAKIIGKSAVWVGASKLINDGSEEENISNLTNLDAVANGFDNAVDMKKWTRKRYKGLVDKNPMYKLTMRKESQT